MVLVNLILTVHDVLQKTAGAKFAAVKLNFITHDKLRFLLENNMRSGPSTVMGIVTHNEVIQEKYTLRY